MLHIGMIGYGYWGPNLLRNFVKVQDCRVVMVADQDATKREHIQQTYPGIETVSDGAEVLNNPDIHAVVIATPISTHYALAKAALKNGKHVLVEKPMTASVAQAADLVRIAEQKRLTLMVDHTFVYTGAVQKIRELIDSGELGDIYYYDSVRVNLGLFQPDSNVLWDLAPHDFSIMAYLLDKETVDISAVGAAPVSWQGWEQESVVYTTVRFADDTLAHFHVNWLSPVKVRRTLIGGSKKMVIYDHLDPDQQIKIFDKGVDLGTDADRYHMLVQYRAGDMLVPKVDQGEALEAVCQDFSRSIQTGAVPRADGQAGLRVVEMLEAAQQSLETHKRLGELWDHNRAQHSSGASPLMSN